jgi:hypothetical protein
MSVTGDAAPLRMKTGLKEINMRTTFNERPGIGAPIFGGPL